MGARATRAKVAKLDRALVEQARNACMLQALFYWQLGRRQQLITLKRKGDQKAKAALRLDGELNGVRRGR